MLHFFEAARSRLFTHLMLLRSMADHVSVQITDTGHDENWFKAILHGVEGYIPKNYVKFTLPWLEMFLSLHLLIVSSEVLITNLPNLQ